MLKREFTVAGEYQFNRASAVRWIISHLARYKHLVITYMLTAAAVNILVSLIPLLTGLAFSAVLQGNRGELVRLALILLGSVLLTGCLDLSARFFPGCARCAC